MSEADCLFCKIVRREIPAGVVYEDSKVLAFKDIHPQAPVHILFVPKEHIPGVDRIDEANGGGLVKLVLAANAVAKKSGIERSGYRLVINNGADGGQSVDHLHLHLLGGREMTWPPG